MLQRSKGQTSETGSDTASQNECHETKGRKRMPHVSSMLFDLELEDQESGDLDHNANILPQACALLKLLQPATQAEKQLGHAVNASFEAAELKGKAPTIDQLADSLRSQGYDVRIRTALGGGATQECLRNLRHSFLTLNLTGADGQLTECIIDPSFAEQWTNARSTPEYAAIIEALPQVYVGSAVEPLVDYLCMELAESFKAEGATLPPWRSVEAMLSKWRPRRSVDCDMLKPYGVGTSRAMSSAFNSSLVSRALLGRRPAKSQRISASGPCHASASGTPSPGVSPAFGSPSVLSTSLVDYSLALKPSASRSQFDVQEQVPPSAAPSPCQAGLLRSRAASVSGDCGSNSDGSVTSDTASFYRSSASAAIPDTRPSRRSHCSLDFSSSWRASDILPFPQAVLPEFAFPQPPAGSSNSGSKGLLSQGGFGSMQTSGLLDDRPTGGVKTSRSLKAPALWLDDKGGHSTGGGLSASDASDTTQGPRRRSAPGLLKSRPPVSSDSIANSHSSPAESGEVCTTIGMVPRSNRPSKEEVACLGASGDQGNNPPCTPLIKWRGSSSGGRAAYHVKPLGNDNVWQQSASISHGDHVISRQRSLQGDIATSMTASLPIASKVAAARESLLRHPANLLS